MMNVHRPAGSQAQGATAASTRPPFGDGNAASQWHPAMTQINAYAKQLGIGSISYKGTGVHAKGLPPPGPARVEATELQNIVLKWSHDGQDHVLGQVLPEGAHLRELKTTAELVAEMKQLITKFGQRGR